MEKKEVKAEEAKVKSLIHDGHNKLDLVFAIDTTSSMSSYIESAKANITKIIETIQASEKCDVQFAIVAYRDHPPQDNTFITQVYDFTPSVKKAKENVAKLAAHGGGDCPEAVSDCLYEVSVLPYRKDTVKVCVFVADAPPHGLPDNSDGLPPGWDKHDPIETAWKLAKSEIIVYSVGCEPQLGNNAWGREFFKTISEITGGRYVALANAKILPEIIVGGVEEEIVMEKLSKEIETETLKVQEEHAKAGKTSTKEEIGNEVASRLQARGVHTSKLNVDNIGVSEDSDELIKEIAKCTTFKEYTALLKTKKAPKHTVSYPSVGFGSPVPAAYGAPPPPMPASSFTFASSPAPPPAATPSYAAQSASNSYSGIEAKQVHKWMSRKGY